MSTESISARPTGAATQRAVVVSTAGQPLGSDVQLHKAGLLFTSKQTLNTWEKVGADLFSFANSSAWWIADWLVYGENTFHDRYGEAVKRTPLSYQTLRNYTWVARGFPPSRRRQALSFSHHLEVAALEQPQQDYWLRKAEELNWSRNKLRTEVRGSLLTQQGETARPAAEGRAEADDVDPARDASGSSPARIGVGPAREARLLDLQLSAEDLANFERAASKEGAPVETWAAQMLRCAAAEG